MQTAISSRIALFAILISLLVPFVASAQANIAAGEDAMCVAFCAQAAANKRPCPQSFKACGVTSGISATGFCMPDGCKGTSAGGSGLSSSLTGLLGQIASGLIQKLMQGGQGGSGGGSDSGSGNGSYGTPSSGCSQYYQVTTPSSDPCAYYVPPVSDSLNTGVGTSVSDQLLNALGATTSSTNTNTNANTNTNTDTNTNTGTQTNTTPKAVIVASSTVVVPVNPANLIPGVKGDIQVLNNGATILAGSRDTTSNTETAGFYGSDSFGGQSQGIVANLCKNRPWSGNFLGKIIPATFFDGLCSLRGYQVGAPVTITTKPTVTVTQTAPKPTTTTKATTTVSTVTPKVDIWATPATVVLGARTSIFWNTQGVTNCTETSPDGSFSQATLSGGASTVPITGATTFTISCLAPDGTPVTDYVTVNLSI